VSVLAERRLSGNENDRLPKTLGRQHRNDHQLATVGQLAGRPGIYVAHTDDDLKNYLLEDLDSPSHEDSSEAGRASLVSYLKNYIAAV
ncbi:hypothetical protein ACCT19_37115, partial [Rhizobium ruizarguesonis]